MVAMVNQEVKDVRRGDAASDDFSSERLFKGEHFDLLRLAMPAGKQLRSHRAPGEVVIQCVEGCVEISIDGRHCDLIAGQLMRLAPRTPHAVRAKEPSLLLVTLGRAVTSAPVKIDKVEEASQESFPASDAPAWTGSGV